MSKFLATSRFKWIDPKQSGLNKYTRTSSKGWVFEVDLEYPKELQELNNDFLAKSHFYKSSSWIVMDYLMEKSYDSLKINMVL